MEREQISERCERTSEGRSKWLSTQRVNFIYSLPTLLRVNVIQFLSTAPDVVKTLIVADTLQCEELKRKCAEKLSAWKSSLEAKDFDALKNHPDLLIQVLTFK